MLVKDLREILADLPDDMLVVLAADAEGNSYGTCYGYDVMAYDQQQESVRYRELTSHLRSLGYDEMDLAPIDAVDCIVLSP